MISLIFTPNDECYSDDEVNGDRDNEVIQKNNDDISDIEGEMIGIDYKKRADAEGVRLQTRKALLVLIDKLTAYDMNNRVTVDQAKHLLEQDTGIKTE